VHAYLITAKPGRLQRAACWVGRRVLRVLALLVMAGLGAIVLVVRCARPVINYAATRAAWLELWAASVTGIDPVGAAIGSGLTDEFIREFHKARTGAPI
jgi:sugar phosphate isomerase/epimerase